MTNYYYKKAKKKNYRKIFRFFSLIIAALGLLTVIYVSFPLISWQIYFAPIVSSQTIEVPIPKTNIVSSNTIKSLINTGAQTVQGVDYTNAQNWFPNLKIDNGEKIISKISSYNLSIPALSIKNATVSTNDYDLAKHLVNYPGTAIPGERGNAVIFGHSTLPQLFNQKDYKTIFANAYRLKVGDEIVAVVNNVLYQYQIFNIIVVDPEDSSALSQPLDDYYLTLVTCTPPGTTWKRLIIKARIKKIS